MFIWGTIIGIQFIVASAEDKAKLKEALVPYIVGCIVIFGAFTIWSIVVNLGQDITSEIEIDRSHCFTCGKELSVSEIENGKCSYCFTSL